MHRRDFLLRSTAALGAAAFVRADSTSAGSAKMARIGISTWSFHNQFSNTRDDDAPPMKGAPLQALDYPEMIADRYHIHQMEIVAPHFASMEPSYLRDLKSRLE